MLVALNRTNEKDDIITESFAEPKGFKKVGSQNSRVSEIGEGHARSLNFASHLNDTL